MRKMIKMSMAAVMIMGVGAVTAQAEGTDILTNIKAKGEIRARYEMVDQDTKNNANAFTNRLSVGISADLLGTDWLSAYAEMTDVRALNDNYNSTSNGETTHATVADPKQTRLTQAYIDVKYGKTKLRAGRQMINLDNERFVGAVGWRQMPQTFDAYTLTDNSIENLNLFASYINQINRVFDNDTGPFARDWETRTLLLNASYKVMDELKVTAYDYMIGFGTGSATGGSDTYGIALTGDIKVSDDVKVGYRAEYARQDDASMENSGYNRSNSDVDADYMNFQLNADVSGFLVGAQYEVLSGTDTTDGKTTFQTPLATLHSHNGFADMFLTTPTAGLEDLNICLGYKSKDFGMLRATYHDYTSEVGSTDYGTELDVTYARAIPGVNNLTGLLKVADFNADSASGYLDTTKFWAMLDYKFATK